MADHTTYKLSLYPIAMDTLQEYIGPMYTTDFDGVQEDNDHVAFYYRTESALSEAVRTAENLNTKVKITTEHIQNQNWNALWESQYDPVQINPECEIRAPHHSPKTGVQYSIVIEPQMSFGTGHHPTTALILDQMTEMYLHEKSVLDYGAGTGVLGIMAMLRGAREVDAVEIEEVAMQNIQHNMDLNQVELNVILGDVHSIPEKNYDVTIANINKNILIADSEVLSTHTRAHGQLLLSGFYERDVEDIVQCYEKHDFSYDFHKSEQDWAFIVLKKCP